MLEEARRESLSAGPATSVLGPPLIGSTKDLRVLVLGDSVGVGLGAGMAQLATERGFDTRSNATIGCPLTLEPGRNRSADGWIVDDPACSNVMVRFDEALREFEPNLVVVVYGGGADFDGELPSGVVSNPCEPPYDAWKLETWKRFMGHVVAADVQMAVATATYFGLPGAPETLDQQTDCLNASLRAAAKQTGARVIELGAWACPNGQPCIDDLAGVPLRPDGLHFNEQLTPAVANWLLSQVVGDWETEPD